MKELLSQIVRAREIDDRHRKFVVSKKPVILVVRHVTVHPQFNQHYLLWLQRHHPDLAGHFLPVRLYSGSDSLRDVRLLVPWLQDPLRERFPIQFRTASRLERRSIARGIPVVNRVADLSHSIKSYALPVIAGLGARTAHVVDLRAREARKRLPEPFGFPFIIREDLLHGTSHRLVEGEDDLSRVDWNQFEDPIGMELVDTRSEDGLYRKYRYVVMGERGVPRHLVISESYWVHAWDRIRTPEAIEEELAYTSGDDPNHGFFAEATRALGLDVVTWDYSYDRDGRLVVWEPNPAAIFWGLKNKESYYTYQEPAMDRLYGELTKFYFERAGLIELLPSL